MYRVVIYFFLPLINGLITVQIHRQALFYSNSSCSFIRNISLSNDSSMQTCIWECQYQNDCQTAVYYHDLKKCSMYSDVCREGRIEPSGSVRSSVICNEKNRKTIRTCSSTSTTSTTTSSTSSTTTSTLTTTVRTLVNITRPGDPIMGLYNTTAGGSTGGKNGRFSTISEFPDKAIDQSTSTKYLNFGVTGGYGITAAAPGVGTGFYVTPTISNASVAVSLRFATADDAPKRDPITVTLEGTNSDLLDNGSSWTLLYNGSTGISLTTDPGRMTYVLAQNFSNTMAYKSYRLLITSQRDEEWAVQYSEAQIIGYVYLN